jgi:hypothetical protein
MPERSDRNSSITRGRAAVETKGSELWVQRGWNQLRDCF